MKDNLSFLCLDFSGVATSENFLEREREIIFQRNIFKITNVISICL